MGLRDWFKKKPEQTQEHEIEAVIELPELDKDSLLEEAISVFESEDEEVERVDLVDATPEYDTGDVKAADLLIDEMDSNYDLNTVEVSEYEDLLEGAEIIGDLPSEVRFETDKN